MKQYCGEKNKGGVGGARGDPIRIDFLLFQFKAWWDASCPLPLGVVFWDYLFIIITYYY